MWSIPLFRARSQYALIWSASSLLVPVFTSTRHDHVDLPYVTRIKPSGRLLRLSRFITTSEYVSAVAFSARDAPRGESSAFEKSRTTERTARRADVARSSASWVDPMPETGINLARWKIS